MIGQFSDEHVTKQFIITIEYCLWLDYGFLLVNYFYLHVLWFSLCGQDNTGTSKFIKLVIVNINFCVVELIYD